MSWLINCAQLDRFRKNQKNLIILDASYHHGERDAKKEFIEKHIIGAQFFDINAFSDSTSDMPHTLIQDEKLVSEVLSSFGIRNDYKIIFYDNSELHSACRALWLLKVYGHNPEQLYILDGGLTAWEQYGGKTEADLKPYSPKSYAAQLQPQFLRTLSQMKECLITSKEQIVDVRHPVRYLGGPEIRTGIRSGHIPGSISFPFFAFFDKNNSLLPLDKIRRRLSDIAIDIKVPIICTCGSGVTATILDFILDLMGHNEHAVYDGSWTEWGSEKLYASETSLAERPVETFSGATATPSPK